MLHFFKAPLSISCNTEKTSRINKMSKSRDMGVTRKVIDDYFVSLRPLLINPPIYVDIEARSIYCHGTRRRRSETQTISIWSSETDWTWILIVKPKSQSHSLSFKKGNCTKADTKKTWATIPTNISPFHISGSMRELMRARYNSQVPSIGVFLSLNCFILRPII